MYIDLFLIVLLLWAVISGWRNGFVKELLNAGGVLTGLVLACLLYWLFPDWLAVTGTESNMMLSIVAFFLLCFIIPIVLGLVANGLTALIKEMHLGLPNSLLGVTVSTVKFLLLISFAFNIMEHLHIMNPEHTVGSHLYSPVRDVLPFVREDAKEHIDNLRSKFHDMEEDSDTTYMYFNSGYNI